MPLVGARTMPRRFGIGRHPPRPESSHLRITVGDRPRAHAHVDSRRVHRLLKNGASASSERMNNDASSAAQEAGSDEPRDTGLRGQESWRIGSPRPSIEKGRLPWRSSTRSSGTRWSPRPPTSSRPTSASPTGSSRASGEGSARRAGTSTPAGRYVLPGGIDTHCHFDQPMRDTVTLADDFLSGTVSAAHGGTTTVMPFACQLQGRTVRHAVDDYHRRAADKPVIDYGFHLIISDPTEAVLRDELPALISRGLHLVQDLHDVRDAQALRSPDHLGAGAGASRGRDGHGARGELRLHRVAHRRARAAGQDRPVLPCRLTAPGGRARGHASRDHHVGDRGRADPARPRLERRRRRADPLGARTRPQDPRRDLPAVSRAHRGPSARPRLRGREVHLQPAAARRGKPAGRVARDWPPASSRSSRRTTPRFASTTPRGSGATGRTRPSRRCPTGCPASRRGCRSSSPRASARVGSISRRSWRSPPPTPPRSTGSIRARAPSPSGPTRTSSSGTRTARS